MICTVTLRRCYLNDILPLWKNQSGNNFMGVIMNENIVKAIQEQVQKIKKEYDIVNEIIRDDVFSILQGLDNCNVLYYPLEGDDIGGCHIEKLVNGKLEQFVFINTYHPREKQAFVAAHELGHIWKVDEKLKECLPNEEFECEEVVNRFAAELLMPEERFKTVMKNYLEKVGYRGPKIAQEELVKLIAYLMNYFFVPYMAVLYRFNELGRLDERYNDIMRRYKESDTLKDTIKTEQYTRLNIVTRLKSLDNLREYLDQAEEQGYISSTKADAIRTDFELPQDKEDDDSEETIDFQEQ